MESDFSGWVGQASLDQAIAGRNRDIKGLRKKHDRLVRRNCVLQAAQVRRHIQHLETLNRNERGPAMQPIYVSRPHVGLWL